MNIRDFYIAINYSVEIKRALFANILSHFSLFFYMLWEKYRDVPNVGSCIAHLSLCKKNKIVKQDITFF